MKIQELAIGDWVRYRDADANVRVSDIYNNGYVFIVGEEDSGISESVNAYHHIEPIPLTPEILEKNGFEKVEPQWYMCEHNGIHISVIVWENQRGRIEISYTSPFDDDNPLYIADFTANIPHIAVHHLQRILHLAGVGKEIEL